jgi:hypothetical protein
MFIDLILGSRVDDLDESLGSAATAIMNGARYQLLAGACLDSFTCHLLSATDLIAM